MGYVGVADAAATVALIEGGVAIMVLARRMLERATQRGREEGKEETQQRWEIWLHRWERAQAEGREFNEPPPNGKDGR